MEQRLTVAAETGNISGLYTLIVAAQVGDINGLYNSIRENPNLLKNIDEIPFVDTPLHIAAALGHTHFAVEVASLWPSFGKKLSPNGLSAIHLAVQNGHTETVKRLISIDGELIRVQGKERRTPLHCAAEMGNVDLLAEFLCACPESIEDLNIRCETALHVSMRVGELGALKVMLGWIRKTGRGKVLNSTDENGDTLLHIAASTNQPQVVKLLLDHKVNKNVKNLEGLTALDIVLKNGNREILAILNCKRAPRGSSVPTFQSLAGFLSSKESFEDKMGFRLGDLRRELSIEKRNMVLVVAVLIATATYQSVLTPPNGIFQADNTTGTAAPMLAGKSVMRAREGFMFLNTLSFGASITVILLVLKFRTYTALLHISLLYLFTSYCVLLIVSSARSSGRLSFHICLCLAYVPLGTLIYYCKCHLYFIEERSPTYEGASDHHRRQMRRILDIRRYLK